jgi:thiazole synthase
MTEHSPFTLAGVALQSRFLLGTAGYPSPQVLREAIAASGAQVVTLGLKRQLAGGAGDNGFIDIIRASGARLLPNTAGCRTAREAVALAHMARELLGTHWIKLEVIGDEHTLQPDPWELTIAAAQLVRDGFEVFPYCLDDLVGAQRLIDAGCSILMPWGAPIGSAQGLLNPWALRTLRARLPDVTLVVDAGIGAPWRSRTIRPRWRAPSAWRSRADGWATCRACWPRRTWRSPRPRSAGVLLQYEQR